MAKPSETLRRTRRWGRAWKTSARHWRALARTYHKLSDVLASEVVKLEEGRRIDAEIRGERETPKLPCSSCGRVHKTYRSAVSRKLHLCGHRSIDNASPCTGAGKPPREI